MPYSSIFNNYFEQIASKVISNSNPIQIKKSVASSTLKNEDKKLN